MPPVQNPLTGDCTQKQKKCVVESGYVVQYPLAQSLGQDVANVRVGVGTGVVVGGSFDVVR